MNEFLNNLLDFNIKAKTLYKNYNVIETVDNKNILIGNDNLNKVIDTHLTLYYVENVLNSDSLNGLSYEEVKKELINIAKNYEIMEYGVLDIFGDDSCTEYYPLKTNGYSLGAGPELYSTKNQISFTGSYMKSLTRCHRMLFKNQSYYKLRNITLSIQWKIQDWGGCDNRYGLFSLSGRSGENYIYYSNNSHIFSPSNTNVGNSKFITYIVNFDKNGNTKLYAYDDLGKKIFDGYTKTVHSPVSYPYLIGLGGNTGGDNDCPVGMFKNMRFFNRPLTEKEMLFLAKEN